MKTVRTAGFAATVSLLLITACARDQPAADVAGGPAAVVEHASLATGAARDADWLPAGIALPRPHEVLQDTALGQHTRLLQVVVQDDPAAEFPRWKAALEAAGYEVHEGMLADGRLLFAGKDVESGQVAVMPAEDGGFMIQVDVSKFAQ